LQILIDTALTEFQPEDLEYFKRLSEITNVIPLLSKSDRLTSEEIKIAKSSILSSLESSAAKPFLFGTSIDNVLCQLASTQIAPSRDTMTATGSDFPETGDPIPPYAISCKASVDIDNMDASLLMSSEYIQPLQTSELQTLISKIFDPANIAWLRHSVAKKLIQWRNKHRLANITDTHHPGYLRRHTMDHYSKTITNLNPFTGKLVGGYSTVSSALSSPSPSQVLVPHADSPFYSNPISSAPSVAGSSVEDLSSTIQHPEFAIARLQDLTEHNEQMARVSIAKWATDLQRSLRNERERFGQMERGRRAQWLLDRVGEEVKNGNTVPSLTPDSASSDPPEQLVEKWAMTKYGGKVRRNEWRELATMRSIDPQDPLGLCEIGDRLKRNGALTLRLLGGVSIVGVVVVAFVKAFGTENEIVGWIDWIAGHPND
jgi:hypothetical protein